MHREFKDYFSKDSMSYAAHRPRYPDALFDWLAVAAGGTRLAWDAGTGSGQAALALAGHFDRVVATDASETQIATAPRHPRVEYRVAEASASGLPDGAVDLATVAQALHWFDRPAYFAEVARVLRPGALLAVWCYEMASVTPEVEDVVDHLYREVLGPWWTEDRRLVEEGYRSVELPWPDLEVPAFRIEAALAMPEFAGYIGTWSAVRRYRDGTREDPMPAFMDRLARAWRDPAQIRHVTWPLAVRAVRREP